MGVGNWEFNSQLEAEVNIKKTEEIQINLKPKPNKIVLESEKYFKIGMTVEHEEYGIGTILSVDGAGPNAKLTISFQKGVLKKIHGR